MIIECFYCESRVDGKVLAEHIFYDPEVDPFEFKVSLIECPACKNALLGGQDNVQVAPETYEWDDAARLLAQPGRYPDLALPSIVSASLIEAPKCYKATAYGACAVMRGRTLEGVCSEFGTKARVPLKRNLSYYLCERKFLAGGGALGGA